MCGRFTQERPASELAEIFAAEPLADELGARYNVAPTDEAFVVVQGEDRRAVTAYRWGLVPHWSTDRKSASRMFNARAETITASPAFPRCVPAATMPGPGRPFYEWKREGAVVSPYRVTREDVWGPGTAGLWRLARPFDRGGPTHVHDTRRPLTTRWQSARPVPVVPRRDRVGPMARRRGGPNQPVNPDELHGDPTERAVPPAGLPGQPIVNDVRRDGPRPHRAARGRGNGSAEARSGSRAQSTRTCGVRPHRRLPAHHTDRAPVPLMS